VFSLALHDEQSHSVVQLWIYSPRDQQPTCEPQLPFMCITALEVPLIDLMHFSYLELCSVPLQRLD
jgi:hypothetical protein